MKKRYIVLIILLVLGLSYWVYSRDESVPRDEDLKLVRILVPAEKNALYPLRQAEENFYLPENQWEKFRNIAEDKKWDEEFVKELLEKNKATLEYFEKAVGFSVYQILLPDKIGLDWAIEPIAGIQDVVRLISIKANHLFKQGKEEEAFDAATKIIKLGHMIENSQGSLITYLMGNAIKEKGLARLRSLTQEATLSSKLLKNYIKELDKFKIPKQGIINAFKLEYESFVTSQEEGFVFPDYPPVIIETFGHFYKPNQTRRMFAETYRFYINNISKPYTQIKGFQHPEMKDFEYLSVIFRPLSENPLGKMLHDVLLGDVCGFTSEKYYKGIFSVAGTQLLLAIKSYQIENGRLPESLAELVPQYFVEVPQDPFDGNPIRYSKEKGIIYSVGRDLKDQDGGEGDLQLFIKI